MPSKVENILIEEKSKIRNLLAHDFELRPYNFSFHPSTKVDEIIRKRKLENDALQQDILLKGKTLNRLFLLLGVETALIFLFAYFQGFYYKGFSLEEWSFKLLVTATLLQITYMLQVAVKHLFPVIKKREIRNDDKTV